MDDAVNELLVDREVWLELWEEGQEVIPVGRGEVRLDGAVLQACPTLSFLPMGFSSADQSINVRIHLSSASRKGVFVPIGQRVHPIFCDPALGVEWRERDLSEVLPVDAMAL